ncbi:probable DNA-directed RNA polymerase III subunit rpc6 [Arachis ipaensis]|nr:probable DNA-directed RNA polymerase III subunit rpc6 [Arachis ipaensis]XP_025640641.1 probable DNA-directed RNA polymerase III subunit rpc6 [Arachis hypogaea]
MVGSNSSNEFDRNTNMVVMELKDICQLMNKQKLERLASNSDNMNDAERIVYNVIHSKQNMGIWMADIKRETTLPKSMIKKSIKMLQTKGEIKEVVNIKNKSKKHYMAAGFEPADEITGGSWYSEGKLDQEYIFSLRQVCLNYVSRNVVANRDGILEFINQGGYFSGTTTQEIDQILGNLVLDDKIIEVKSTGYGDYEKFPVGRICYRCKSKGGVNNGEGKIGAMASIPCGVCPRINLCSPDSFISPQTCELYQKWLDF